MTLRLGTCRALAVIIGVCVFSAHANDAASFTSVQSGAWSDPSTWAGTASDDLVKASPRLPGVGDDVLIASGTTVIFDAKLDLDNPLNSVSVQSRATLTCPRNAEVQSRPDVQFTLSTSVLRVESGGCVSCGYGNCTGDAAAMEPFAGKFVLRLTSPRPPANESENVRTLMVESGGALFLSGAPRVRAIAHLAEDVEAGQAVWRVAEVDVVGGGRGAISKQQQPWRVGDRVAIAPTDSIPSQTEYATIVGVEPSGSGAILTISDPLKYARNGRVLTLVNKPDNNRQVIVDTRAEIALLSRNVVIEGTNDAVTGLGGDLMLAGDNVRALLSWVELRYLGRRGHLARYPLHIHNLGDSGRNVYVSNSVIHSSFQRGVVVHCTNGVTLINNTVAGSPGFAYMLEDGAEENNALIGNYAIDVKPADYPLIQTERVNSAGFWFVNAANTFVGNVAAGVAGVGFSLDMDPVLSSRPSTLSTCPERLPGYDAKLARENVPEFNRAVNTALIKKNFVRFDDNVVHSAYSGLWMSYPFTPMFFVDRPVPIARFTAWNLAARRLPSSSLDSSDGVSLQFDGCIRLQGQRGMHIYQPTCINADSATWASCVNTFEGLTVAWVVDAEGLKRRSQSPGTTTNKPSSSNSGIMLTHLEPQVFLKTQVVVGLSSNNPPSPPLFASISKGGPLATLNALSGLAIDQGPSATPSMMIQLKAGDMHVFTDVKGDAFGAGPGAVVAATPFNATGVDPLVDLYAAGQCRTGAYASDRRWPHVSSSSLPNGRAVSVAGGLPMLCAGPLRFTGLSVGLIHSTSWTKTPQSAGGGAFAVDIGSAGSNADALRRRRTGASPVMLPLNDASMHPVDGGYEISIASPQLPSGGAADILEMSLTPTIQPSDGMTFVIKGLPPNSRISKQQPGGVQPLALQASTSASCRQLVGGCATAKRTSNKPTTCVCWTTDKQEEVAVRLQAGLSPRNVGLAAKGGGKLGLYDFPVLRIDF